MKATASLFDLLFGCWHKNLSFPRSVKRGRGRTPAAFPNGTYVVCLDCGKEFAYDWTKERADPSHSTAWVQCLTMNEILENGPSSVPYCEVLS